MLCESCEYDERGARVTPCDWHKRLANFSAANSPAGRGTWHDDLFTPTTTIYSSRRDFEQ